MRIPLFLIAASLTLAACSSSDPASQTPAKTDNTPAQPTAPAAPSGPFSAASLEAFDQYERTARDFAAAIEAAAPLEQLNGHAQELVKIADSVLPEFVAVRPDCKEYLETAMTLREIWTNLSAEEIETGYHKDNALPKVTNGAACYHMKDLIVHPITAQALLAEDAEGNRGEAKHEIDEVIAHVSVVKATR